ncbi:MAG: Do family serine endopeptidase [Muribaculaceae bacterium]|nr:Do family serine endopeptidase [Muribaculaceae bacterium]
MKNQIILLSLTLAAAACTNAQGVPGRVISQDDFIRAAENTVNGVVSVKSFATPRQQQMPQQGFFNDPFFEYFFGAPQQRPERRQAPAEQQQVGLGSGVIISADGLIVTNNHVIDGAERLEVTLNDNRNFTAEVVGADPVTDLAVIRISAPDLHVIPMGDSDSLHVGEWVLAVGNPFGFTSTVTSGIVSAKARNISTTTRTPSSGGIESYIQTDAAVNRGNSGGALVNLDGELVGINTAIYSQTGTYAGCSFAIPTSIVQKVVDDISRYGMVQRAFLGISFTELTPELIKKEGLKDVTRGIYVAEVQDRTAAREAGFKPGDVIVTIDGEIVGSTATLQEIMAKHSPGDVISIGYMRDGKPAQVKVTLRNRNGQTDVLTPQTAMGVLGAVMTKADDETLRRLEISRGVSVDVQDGGLFAKAGMPDGFVITSINNTRVASPDDIEQLFQAIRALPDGSDKVMFISGITPSGRPAYYAIDLN